MKLYPCKALLNFEGQPYKEGTVIVTTRMLLASILDIAPDGKKLTGDQKMRRFNLQARMYEPDVVSIELTVDEIALIKEVLDDAPGVTPNLYGQIMAQMTGE